MEKFVDEVELMALAFRCDGGPASQCNYTVEAAADMIMDRLLGQDK